MRSLVPADSLVYLETNDLAAALQPIVDNKAFEAAARSKPDLSALKGVQMAVAVTGFAAEKQEVTDQHWIGKVTPQFVVVADTHAWDYQAVRFVEERLDSFVAEVYDSEPMLEKSDKHGGSYFTWTAEDRRKAYALVIDGIVYFGNDESAIEKCLDVRRGETDSIAKAGKVAQSDAATLASGYVSNDGIAQLASIVGLKFAKESSDEPDVQSAVAGVLPQLIRNSVVHVAWSSNKNEHGMNDVYLVSMSPNIPNDSREILDEMGQAIHESIYGITAADLAAVLSERKLETEPIDQNANGQNHLTKTGIERRTVSDFGLIGALIAQMGSD